MALMVISMMVLTGASLCPGPPKPNPLVGNGGRSSLGSSEIYQIVLEELAGAASRLFYFLE